MLIIGHRGAAGLAPENTPEALRAGMEAGADILEFDVRLTADMIPVVVHDKRLHESHVSRTTLTELKKLGVVTTLESILDEFFGEILLNLEYKPVNSVEIVYKLLQEKYIKHSRDWDNIIVSSFHVRPLAQLRSLNKHINLALLHSINPFAFVTYQRRLRLSAVGWHRLHVNSIVIAIAQKAGLFTYVYTVNRPDAAIICERKGIDAVVTDYPDRIAKKL